MEEKLSYVVTVWRNRSEAQYAFVANSERQLSNLLQMIAEHPDCSEPEVRVLNKAALFGTGLELA